jgi:intraflagellar transport protein 80
MDLENSGMDIDWAPMTKGNSDLFAIGFADGSFKLINRNGRVDKTVTEAHKGCVTSLKWSYDGGALATAGEDGSLKIWSKNGNIRSNLVTSEKPIYCVTWSPDSDAVLYCSDKSITIKPMTSSNKLQQWKAHDGIVLKADWNPSNNLIVSCGEDCRYKVWDNYGNGFNDVGRQLYSSSPYDYVVTSLSWSPNGEYFAVGAFGMFKLCDKTGWTYSFHKTNIGSISKINWSADGTMCCGASGSGAVLFGEVVDRQLNFENW